MAMDSWERERERERENNEMLDVAESFICELIVRQSPSNKDMNMEGEKLQFWEPLLGNSWLWEKALCVLQYSDL
jgi:hypothetical protein